MTNQGISGVTFSQWTSGVTVPDNNGKIGKCYINSSHSAGGLISDSPISIGPSQSMFCWFKFTDLESSSSLGGGLVNMHRYPKNTGMGITIKYVSATTGYLSVNTGTGSSRTYNTYCGTTLLQANTWYHGGFTYDGTNVLKIYVNGVCEYTGNIGQMSCPEDYMTVFCWSTSNSSGRSIHSDYKFSGSINDVRVYDHALSPKEIEVLSRGLVVHYPLSLPMPNLLPHTTPSYGLGYMNSYSSGTVAVDSTETFCGNSTIRIQPSSSTTSSGGTNYYNSDSVKLTSGVKYCYSCWIKSTVEDTFTTGSLGHFQTVTSSAVHNRTVHFEGMTIPANTWTQVYIVFTPTADCSFRSFFIYFANTSQKIWVSKVKLEQGDHPTPYCPGSGDTEYSAMGFNDTTEYDVSGYNHHGTKVGTLTYDSDTPRYSACTVFNGTDATINCGHAFHVQGAKNMSMSCWAYSDNWSSTENKYFLSSQQTGGVVLGYLNGTTARARWHVYTAEDLSSYAYKQADYEITLTNGWHHFCGTCDEDQIKLYLDGVLVKTTSATNYGIHFHNSASMFIGAESAGSSYSDLFTGKISDVRIYYTTLTDDQVARLYNTPVSLSNNGTLMAYEFVEQ